MSLLIFILILGILIIVHEWGHFMAARRVGVRVETFSLGFGPVLFKKKKKHTEYSLSAIPLGGYVKLAGDNLEEYKGKPDEYFSKRPGERFQIIFAGPLLNYILGFLLLWLIFFAGYPSLTSKVGGLIDGLGAKEAGLVAGDKIIAVDGRKVEFWEDLQIAIQKRKVPNLVNLSVMRGSKPLSLDVRIEERDMDDPLGQKRKVGIIGITPFDEVITVRHGVADSFFRAINKTLEFTYITYKGLWRMITGKLSFKESVTGPLGIFDITSKAAGLGIIPLLHLIAVLSISLALFNLLPLPVLDGGHIVLLGLEKIRGRTIGIKAERVIMQVGISFIIFLAIFVTYNDIVRLYGDKIQKFFLK